MIRSFITAAILFAYCSVQGQLAKGSYLVGGLLNYHGSRSVVLDKLGKELESRSSGEMGLQCRGGYFVSNRVALGVLAGTSYSWMKISSRVMTRPMQQSYGGNFGLFARVYQTFREGRFAFFAQANAYYMYLGAGSSGIGKQTGFAVSLAPGFSYFVTRNIALESTIGNASLLRLTQKNQDGSINRNTESNIGITPSNFLLGLTFYFGHSE